jgi:hypothetical protein
MDSAKLGFSATMRTDRGMVLLLTQLAVAAYTSAGQPG